MGRNRKGCRCSQAGENTHCGRVDRVLPTIPCQFQSSAEHRVLEHPASEQWRRENTDAAFAGCCLGAPATGCGLTVRTRREHKSVGLDVEHYRKAIMTSTT